MLSVYVAGSLERKGDARIMAAYLRDEGYRVTSTWHDGDATREREREMSLDELTAVWRRNRGQIDASNVFVVVASGRETLCELESARSGCIPVLWLDEAVEPPLTGRIIAKVGKRADVLRLLEWVAK